MSFNKKLLAVTLACALCVPEAIAETTDSANKPITLDDIIKANSTDDIYKNYRDFYIASLPQEGTDKFNNIPTLNNWYPNLPLRANFETPLEEEANLFDGSSFDSSSILKYAPLTNDSSTLSTKNNGLLRLLSTVHKGKYTNAPIDTSLKNNLIENFIPSGRSETSTTNRFFSLINANPKLKEGETASLKINAPTFFNIQSYNLSSDQWNKKSFLSVSPSSQKSQFNLQINAPATWIYEQSYAHHENTETIDYLVLSDNATFHPAGFTLSTSGNYGNVIIESNSTLSIYADSHTFVGALIDNNSEDPNSNQKLVINGDTNIQMINSSIASGINILGQGTLQSTEKGNLTIHSNNAFSKFQFNAIDMVGTAFTGISLDDNPGGHNSYSIDVDLKGNTHISADTTWSKQEANYLIREYLEGIFIQSTNTNHYKFIPNANNLQGIDFKGNNVTVDFGVVGNNTTSGGTNTSVVTGIHIINTLPLNQGGVSFHITGDTNLYIRPKSIVNGSTVGIYVENTQKGETTLTFDKNVKIINPDRKAASRDVMVRDKGDNSEQTWQTGVHLSYLGSKETTNPDHNNKDRIVAVFNGGFETDALGYGIYTGGLYHSFKENLKTLNETNTDYRYRIDFNGDINITNSFSAISASDRSLIRINKNADPSKKIIIKGRVSSYAYSDVDITLSNPEVEPSYILFATDYSKEDTNDGYMYSTGRSNLTLTNGAKARVGSEESFYDPEINLIVKNGLVTLDNSRVDLPYVSVDTLDYLRSNAIAMQNSNYARLYLESKDAKLRVPYQDGVTVFEVNGALPRKYEESISNPTFETASFHQLHSSNGVIEFETYHNPSRSNVTGLITVKRTNPSEVSYGNVEAKGTLQIHLYVDPERAKQQDVVALIKALDLNPIITMDAKAYKVATGTDTPEADKFTVVPLDPFVFKTPSTHKAYQFVIEHSTKGDYTAKHKDSNKYLYGNSPDDGVWYLTNFKETEPPKEPEPKPVKPTPTPEPDPGKPTPDNPKPDPGKPAPVNPEPNTPKPGTTVVTPAVAAHATLPQIGLENLYQMRDTLYQRLGDVSLANASHNGAWVLSLIHISEPTRPY